MTLRELMIGRILFAIDSKELAEKYSIFNEDFDELSDIDLFELYEDAMELV